jgi:hypothetical protein
MNKIVITLSLLFVASCTAGDVQNTGTATTPAPAGFDLLRHNLDPDEGLPAAAIRATLTVRDNCLWARTPTGEDYLTLWPQDSQVTQGGEAIAIDDQLIPIGQELDLGGGEVSEGSPALEGVEIPNSCQGSPIYVVVELIQ